MQFKKCFKHKAISPLIAGVLLVVFTIIISNIIVNFMSGYVSETTSEASSASSVVVSCTSVNLEISKVYADTYTGRVKVVVSDTGLSDAVLKDVLVFDREGNSCSATNLDSAIKTGEIKNIELDCSNISFKYDCSEFDSASVSTTCSGKSFKSDKKPVCTGPVIYFSDGAGNAEVSRVNETANSQYFSINVIGDSGYADITIKVSNASSDVYKNATSGWTLLNSTGLEPYVKSRDLAKNTITLRVPVGDPVFAVGDIIKDFGANISSDFSSASAISFMSEARRAQGKIILGSNEVYAVSWGAPDYLYQYKWNGSGWSMVEVGPVNQDSDGVKVGDGDNDGMNEVYAVNENNNLFEFEYNGSGWIKTLIGNTPSFGWSLDIGDGNNDGLNEVYTYDWSTPSLRKWYKENGSYEYDSVFNSPSGTWIQIDDSDNDFKNELYILTGYGSGGDVRQVKFNSGSWEETIIGLCDSDNVNLYSQAFFAGDGDNDGLNEIYCGKRIGTNPDFYLEYYKYFWNGSGWDNLTIASVGPLASLDVSGIVAGDADNDGLNAVYASDSYGRLYEMMWNGTGWETSQLLQTQFSLGEMVITDGDNDGLNEIYAIDGQIDGSNPILYIVYYNQSGWFVENVTTLVGGASSARLFGLDIGDGEYSNGSVISSEFAKPSGRSWARFYVNDSASSNASIIYTILDSGNNTIRQVRNGDSLFGIQSSALKIMANMSTANMSSMPVIYDWALIYV